MGIFGIICALISTLRLLRILRIEQAISWCLAPFLRLLGIGREAVTITLIGLTLGLSFGGGLLIREAQAGHVGKDDVLLNGPAGLYHSIIEDTLLILLIGGHLSGIFGANAVCTGCDPADQSVAQTFTFRIQISLALHPSATPETTLKNVLPLSHFYTKPPMLSLGPSLGRPIKNVQRSFDKVHIRAQNFVFENIFQRTIVIRKSELPFLPFTHSSVRIDDTHTSKRSIHSNGIAL